MRARLFCAGCFILVVAGCMSPGERMALKPLPDDGPPLPYAELLTRARLQAQTATEAFYVNKWGDLEDTAKGIEQTARYLPKAIDVPPKQKNNLAVISSDLVKDAQELREAAQKQDVDKANKLLQSIHLRIRELRLGD